MAVLTEPPAALRLAAAARPFAGLVCRVPTPFFDDEALDLESLDRAIRLSASVGVDALTILGEFGEGERLTEGESFAVVKAAVDAAGALPVIVDAVQTGTAARIAFARQVFDLGAAAIALTIPLGFDEARLRHGVERLANAVALPIVLTESPGLHRDSRSAAFVTGLALDTPAVVSIRADYSAGAQRTATLRDRLGAAERAITVLGRLEAFIRPFDASVTPDGVMIGLAFPEIARALLDSLRAPSHAAAVWLGQETDSALIKEVLRQRRLFTSSQVRHPGAPADDGARRYVRNLVDVVLSDDELSRIVDLTPRPFLVNI